MSVASNSDAKDGSTVEDRVLEPPAPGSVSEKRRMILDGLLANNYSEIIKPDQVVEDFLADDDFWENKIEDDRDIPLPELLERDPTFTVVGKELELLTGKLAIVKAAKLEYQRQRRTKELTHLLSVIEYLKGGSHKNYIRKRERRIIDSGKMDWEPAYHQILDELVEKEGLNMQNTLNDMEEQRNKLNLTLKIPEELITDKLHDELPTPVTYFLLGDMGSGKSFIQRRLEKYRQKLYSTLGLNGYDRLLLRDTKDKNVAYLRTLPSGEGKRLMNYYDDREETKQKVSKWTRRSIIGALAFPPIYQAAILGWELAKYRWGLIGDINPIADLGMWINANFHWIAFYGGVFVYSQVEKWVKASGILERLSKRPQWIVDSLRSEPVIIGDLNREKIVGKYEVNFKMPPQLGLVEKPNWLQTDGGSLIVEQLSDLSHDAQSIFAQMIQEREFPIADRGEYTTPYLAFLSVGQNPHVMKDLIPPLKDRLKLGYGCVVVNAIGNEQEGEDLYDLFVKYVKEQDPNSSVYLATTDSENVMHRSKRVERTFKAFLKDFREKAGAKPLDKECLDFLVEASSAFAEDQSKLIINREYLGVLNSLMTMSTMVGGECITKKDAAIAALITRTSDQKVLMPKVESEYKKMNGGVSPIGGVTLLSLMLEQTDDDPYLKEIAEENSFGYLLPISAKVKDGEGIDVHEFGPLSSKKVEYQEKLRLLLEQTGVKYGGKHIDIDATHALTHDDTLLTGMYLAARSALEKKQINLSKAVACAVDHKGGLTQVNKLNKRLLTAYERLDDVVAYQGDWDRKVNSEMYASLGSISSKEKPFTGSTVRNIDELYKAVTIH